MIKEYIKKTSPSHMKVKVHKKNKHAPIHLVTARYLGHSISIERTRGDMYLGRINGFNIRFKCISYNSILFRAQKYIDAVIKNKNSTKYITDSKKRTLMKINDILMESGFSPLTLKVDNPKGNWLEDKRKYSEKNGRRPSGRLNILGSTTGWFNREAFIPVSLLKNIKGTNDEQKKVRQSDLDWLVNFMGEHGKLPDADWHEFNEYAPMIVIGQDGIPFVNEGNHRIMAADKLGFVALPVEIKYYNGGELEKGILSPDKVSEYDTKMRDAGVFYGNYKPENKAVNESGVDVKGLQDSLIEKYDLKSLMLHLDSSGRLEIGMIAVGKENMGQGTGSLVMQEITDFADTHGLIVTLTTGVKDPNFGTTSQSRLIKFYKRFGFVQNKGRNKDFTISRSMYRLPQ